MATLLTQLMARSERDLAALAATWGAALPGHGHAEDVVALYRVMTDSWALRDILAALSPAAAQLLWQFVRDDGAAPVVEHAAGPTDELRVVGLLYNRAEGQSESGSVVAEEMAARLRRLAVERRGGDRSREPLATLIASLSAGELAVAAEQWRVAAHGQPRSAIEARLLEAVAAPMAVREVVANLARTERDLFDMLERAGVPARLSAVRTGAGRSPLVLRRALRRLHERLLVWESWSARERWLFVPLDMRRAADGTGSALNPVAADAEHWRHPRGLAWDVLASLRLRQTDARRGEHGASSIPNDYLWWGHSGDQRSTGYRAFLQAATSQVEGLGTLGPWAARSLTDQQRALTDAWLSGLIAPEIPSSPADLIATRRAIANQFANIEPAAWCLVGALAMAMHRRLATASRRLLSPDAMVGVIEGPLTWLGLLEPGRETSTRRPTVRLTPFGAWVVGLADPPPEPPPSVVLEASLRVLVYEADSTLLWMLLAFARPEQLDRVSVYQLTRDSVLRGVAAGLTAEDMLKSLAAVSVEPAPQNVAYAVRDWTRPARPAQVARCISLTFGDVAARDQVLTHPELRRLGAESHPPARLSVPIPDAASEARAWKTLRELGLVD